MKLYRLFPLQIFNKALRCKVIYILSVFLVYVFKQPVREESDTFFESFLTSSFYLFNNLVEFFNYVAVDLGVAFEVGIAVFWP